MLFEMFYLGLLIKKMFRRYFSSRRWRWFFIISSTFKI